VYRTLSKPLMSHQNAFPWLSSDHLDTTLAKVGILASILLLSLRLFSTQVLFVVIPVTTGLACALYFGIHRRQTTATEYPALPRWVIDVLPAVVVVSLAALVGTMYVVGGRSPSSYILAGTIGTAILTQALLADESDLSPSLIVIQVAVSAVVIRLSVLFVTPGFVGVDIWTHVPVFIDGIVDAGSLSALADSKYRMAPFYHTIGALATLVFGSARLGVYLSLGVVVPLSVLLVYATGVMIVSPRWAAVATTLFAFADQYIRWGLHIIPTSLGLVFFLGAVYCVTRLCVTNERWVIAVLTASSLATVFTHQVSTVILLIVLGIAAGALTWARLLDRPTLRPTRGTVAGVAGVFVGTLLVTGVSWSVTPWYADEPFLYEILDTLRATVIEEAGFLALAGGGGRGAGGTESVSQLGGLIPFLEWLGFALLLATGIVGGLAMLRTDHPSSLTVTYLASTATMFVAVFGLSLFGVRAILPGRWMAFMYALLAILGAVGLANLSGTASKRVLLAVFVVLALSYPMSMVVAEKATLDSPAFEETHPRFSYTDAEIAAVETIRGIYPSEETDIDSDHPYRTVFGQLGGYTAWTAEVDESGPTRDHPVIRRAYQSRGPAVVHTTDPSRSVLTPTVSADRLCPPTRNKVYANDEVSMCTSTSVTGGAV